MIVHTSLCARVTKPVGSRNGIVASKGVGILNFDQCSKFFLPPKR